MEDKKKFKIERNVIDGKVVWYVAKWIAYRKRFLDLFEYGPVLYDWDYVYEEYGSVDFALYKPKPFDSEKLARQYVENEKLKEQKFEIIL